MITSPNASTVTSRVTATTASFDLLPNPQTSFLPMKYNNYVSRASLNKSTVKENFSFTAVICGVPSFVLKRRVVP